MVALLYVTLPAVLHMGTRSCVLRSVLEAHTGRTDKVLSAGIVVFTAETGGGEVLGTMGVKNFKFVSAP